MGRWEPNAVHRLQLAAIELFADRGYEQTTAAEIAKRAGLTERTFFRHFADKREVLFLGSEELQRLMVAAALDAPASAAPIDAIAAALDAAGSMMQDRRAGATVRRAVIAANPELQERELRKLASLAGGLTEALRSRGTGDLASSLAAEAGIAVFRIGFERWLDESNALGLVNVLRNALAELREVTAAR